MRLAGALCALAAVLAGTAAGAVGPGQGVVAGRVIASPLSLTVDVSDSTPKAGHTFKVRAHVTNGGPTAIVAVGVRVVPAPQLVLLDPATQTIARIGAGHTQTVHWQLCAPAPGNYVVLARATYAGITVDSTAVLVSVQPVRRPAC